MDSAIIRSKFIEYCRTRQNILREPNYDCTEIADDLVEIFPQALVYKIEINGYSYFNVKEYEQVKEFVNHYVVAADGYILDPRFQEEPVPFNDYFTRLFELNPSTANQIIVNLDYKDYEDINTRNLNNPSEQDEQVTAERGTETQAPKSTVFDSPTKSKGISLDFFKKD